MVIWRWSKTKISADGKKALVSRILSLTELEFVLIGFVRWLVLLLKRTREIQGARRERKKKIFSLCGVETGLLDFDLGAGGFDLFLDLSGFFLGDTLFEGFRCALNESFGFSETEACHSCAHFFDDADLI